MKNNIKNKILLICIVFGIILVLISIALALNNKKLVIQEFPKNQKALDIERNYQNINTGVYYESLKEALETVESNQTIKVLNSKTETTAPSLASGKTSVKLDMNGQTVTLKNVALANNGELDIYNSSSADGKLTGSGTRTIINSGTLTTNGASNSNKLLIENTTTAPNNRIILNNEGKIATLNMNTYISFTNAIVQQATEKARYLISNVGLLTIQGAIATNTVSNTIYDRGLLNTGATARTIITSGTIISYGIAIYSSGAGTTTPAIEISGTTEETVITSINAIGILNSAIGTINVYGGKISGTNSIYNSSTGTINVTGGMIIGENYGVVVSEGATLTIGTNEQSPVVSMEAPYITGEKAGVHIDGILNFYDGVIVGKNGRNSIEGNVETKPMGYVIVKTYNESTLTETSTLMPENSIIPKKIELNKTSGKIIKGKAFKLQATIYIETGAIEKTVIMETGITWASSNENIATVDENGIVTGINIGECNITATTTNGKSTIFEAEVVLIENEYSKYNLLPGLNIIAIDLGGPTDIDRENSAYGDATLIEQNSNYLLIDSGTDDDNDILIGFLKSQGVKRFSIYLSHYHNDHYGKIKEILNDSYFTVENVYMPNPNIISTKLDENKDWHSIISPYVTWAERYKEQLINLGTNVVFINEGSTINIGNATLEVIWDLTKCSLTPEDYYDDGLGTVKNHFINDTSLVSMITYQGIKFLTSGDIEVRAEKEILESGLDIKADIFKFAHHGGLSSNNSSFIDKINPSYGYLPNNYTAGKNNISWFGDRIENFDKYKNATYNENAMNFNSYGEFVDNLTSKTNVLSTVYNGNIIYNISPNGIISTDVTRNYNTLTIKYIDKNTNEEIEEPKNYFLNNRSVYHLDNCNYIKDIDDYVFLNSTYISNNILTEDTTVICYYQEGVKFEDYIVNVQTEKTYLENIEPETTLEEFISNDKIKTNGAIQVFKNGEIVTNNEEKISTGMELKILTNKIYEYTIVVKGDTNGDGDCNISDILQVNKHRLKKTQLTNEKFLAGDVNKDNKVDIRDIMLINKIRLGKSI